MGRFVFASVNELQPLSEHAIAQMLATGACTPDDVPYLRHDNDLVYRELEDGMLDVVAVCTEAGRRRLRAIHQSMRLSEADGKPVG